MISQNHSFVKIYVNISSENQTKNKKEGKVRINFILEKFLQQKISWKYSCLNSFKYSLEKCSFFIYLFATFAFV